MFGSEAASGIVALIVMALLFVLAVLALLMPWFVYRIHKETIRTNELLTRIAAHLGNRQSAPPAARSAPVKTADGVNTYELG